MQNINQNKYNLNFQEEYNFWINHVIDKWIEIKNLFQNCKDITLKINKNIKSISNPVIMRCKKAICIKVVNLKTNTIF